MIDQSRNGTLPRLAAASQTENSASEPRESQVILAGTPAERAAVVARLQQAGKVLVPLTPDPPPPPFYRFDGEPNWEPAQNITFDDIGRDYALYTLDPSAFGVTIPKDISSPEDEQALRLAEVQIVAQINRIVPEANVYFDWLMTGTDISATDISANEGPGISPGGMPYWLPVAVPPAVESSGDGSATSSEDRSASTAIIVFDTAPASLDASFWPATDRPLDGWADFTALLVRDPIRAARFHRAIGQRNIWMDVTAKMRADLRKGVEHHGLMVASICRDNAPPNTKIFLMRVQDTDGIGTVHTLSSAMYYALHLHKTGQLGCTNLIFNLSLGLPASVRKGIDAKRLLETIADVLHEDNTLIVCAAGNSYPSSLREQRIDAEEPGVFYKVKQELEAMLYREGAASDAEALEAELARYGIDAEQFGRRLLCVGATDRADYTDKAAIDYAPFSKNADLLAPGMNLLLRTYEQGYRRYALWSGTSFAVPQVSALAARLLAGGIAIGDIRTTLKGTGRLITRTDAVLGSGLSSKPADPNDPRQIDPEAALARLAKGTSYDTDATLESALQSSASVER